MLGLVGSNCILLTTHSHKLFTKRNEFKVKVPSLLNFLSFFFGLGSSNYVNCLLKFPTKDYKIRFSLQLSETVDSPSGSI